MEHRSLTSNGPPTFPCVLGCISIKAYQVSYRHPLVGMPLRETLSDRLENNWCGGTNCFTDSLLLSFASPLPRHVKAIDKRWAFQNMQGNGGGVWMRERIGQEWTDGIKG